MRIVGIDPGKKGAVAEILCRPGTLASVSRTLRMPWVDVGKAREVLDLRAVRDFLAEGGPPDLVVVEELGYLPGDAGRAFGMISLMREYGKILGLLELHHRYREVRPQNWQARVVGEVKHDPLPKPKVKGRPTTAERRALAAARKKRVERTKAATLAAVRRLYPDAPLVPAGCRVPNEGVVDAVAIAHYGRVAGIAAAAVIASPLDPPVAVP